MVKQSFFLLAIILAVTVCLADGRIFEGDENLLERVLQRSIPDRAYCCDEPGKAKSTCDNGISPIRHITQHPDTFVTYESTKICREDCRDEKDNIVLIPSPMGLTCKLRTRKGGDPKTGTCCPRFLESSCPAKTCASGDDLLRRMVPQPDGNMYCPKCPVCTSECPSSAKVITSSKVCVGKEVEIKTRILQLITELLGRDFTFDI